MKEQEKQLLLADLYARLPYGVNIKIGKYSDYKLIGIITTDVKPIKVEVIEKGISYKIEVSPDIVKSYLRPMSSMTEEEAMEIAILHDIKDILSVKVTNDYIDVIVDDGVCSTERRTIWYDEIVSSIKCFDWLNEHHFDYRDLIEQGLAIEAPDGMYK